MSPAETQRHTRFLRNFTANEPAIRAHVRRMVSTRGDADEVIQEVSVVLWEKFDTLREDGDFRMWAFGAARYEVLTWMRDKGRDRLVLNENVFARPAEEAWGVIEAPAEFHFESAQRLHMRRGRPAAETHVFERVFTAKATGAGAGKSLRGGDAVTMNQGANDARELRSSAFIQLEELPDLPAGQRDRSAAADSLKSDPALLALTDFESESAIFLTVQGRWPGSRAMEFVNVGDHFKLDADGGHEWPQFMLAAWVCLDRLDVFYQSLLHTGRFDKDPRQTTAHPARPGPAQIGKRDRTARELSGRANELFPPGRAMTDGEGRGLFEAGNPYR